MQPSHHLWPTYFGAGDIFAVSDSAGIFHRSPSAPTQMTFGPTRYQIGAVTPDGKRLLVTASEHHPELVRYDAASKGFVTTPTAEHKQVRVGSNHPEVLFSVGDLNVYVSELGPWGDN